MMGYSLPRNERLRSLKAIRRLFTEGQSGFVYPFRHLLLVESVEAQAGGLEVMFSVPKKFHKRANKRNLLKRRMREAFRLNCQALREKAIEQGVALDMALVLSTKDVVSYKTIEYAVKRILEQVYGAL
jgi:ribonuclease P protein component